MNELNFRGAVTFWKADKLVTAQIEISIDRDRLVRALGMKAALNRSRKARGLSGVIVAECLAIADAEGGCAMKALAYPPLLSRVGELELGRRAHAGDVAARNELVMRNLRLVSFVARGYGRRSPNRGDLLQAGYLGLIDAAARWDPARGTRFSTVAVWRIRQAMHRHSIEAQLIRLSGYALKMGAR